MCSQVWWPRSQQAWSFPVHSSSHSICPRTHQYQAGTAHLSSGRGASDSSRTPFTLAPLHLCPVVPSRPPEPKRRQTFGSEEFSPSQICAPGKCTEPSHARLLPPKSGQSPSLASGPCPTSTSLCSSSARWTNHYSLLQSPWRKVRLWGASVNALLP